MKGSIDKESRSQLVQSVLEALRARRIGEALDQMDTMVQYAQDSPLGANIQEIRTNYSAMLSFLMRGGTDDNRFQVQSNIVEQAWALLYRIYRSIRLTHADDTYCRTVKRLTQEGHNAHTLMQLWTETPPSEQRLDLQDTLFDYLWTSAQWNKAQGERWQDFLLRQDELVQRHLLWAVFLAVWEFPDLEKITLITSMTASKVKAIRITAITSLMLITQEYGDDLSSLTTWNPTLHLSPWLPTIAIMQREMAIMLASMADLIHEQEDIERIMHDNIEQVMQNVLRIKMQYTRKRLQMGYDPNLTRLSTLHSSKFLSTCSHWFLPFDSAHPLAQYISVDHEGNAHDQLAMLPKMSIDCDIDQYIMCEMISNNLTLAKTLTEQMKRINVNLPKELNLPDMTLRHIAQNLFRFFTQSPIHSELHNPFASHFPLITQAEYRTPDGEEHCILCAEALHQAGQCAASVRLLQSMAEQYGASTRLLRLEGRCHEELHHQKEAYQCYMQSTFLEEPDLSTAHSLFQCSLQLDKCQEAYKWLEHLITLDAQTNKWRQRKVQMLMMDHRWEDALKELHHLHYDDTSDWHSILNIVKCEMMMQHIDTADKYLDKLPNIPDRDKCSERMLNADLEFIQGNWKCAREHYVTAYKRLLACSKHTIEQFRQVYEQHRDYVTTNGISHQDFCLMWDAVWQTLTHEE